MVSKLTLEGVRSDAGAECDGSEEEGDNDEVAEGDEVGFHGNSSPWREILVMVARDWLGRAPVHLFGGLWQSVGIAEPYRRVAKGATSRVSVWVVDS